MNKSTPINQLPANNGQQGNFINDQQRQMITQAQQAIQTSTFPQNTQISADLANDDDPTIQEVLNQFNPQQQNPDINFLHQQQVMAQAQAQQQQIQQQQLFAQLQAAQAQQQQQFSPQEIVPPNLNNVIMDGYLNHITGDIKLAAVIFTIYIIVNFIPIESIISRYFPIDKIPYHQIILRASLAASLFMLVKKLIL
jgi:hypothetical protein